MKKANQPTALYNQFEPYQVTPPHQKESDQSGQAIPGTTKFNPIELLATC